MKAERRHELKENQLAKSLENLPKAGRESGSKLLLGIIVVLLAIALVRLYINNRADKKAQLIVQVNSVRNSVDALRSVRSIGSPQSVGVERNRQFRYVQNTVDDILAASPSPAQVGSAKTLRADACLAMASLGEPPEATTQPDARLPRKPDELLDEATREYQDVLAHPKGVAWTDLTDAHFGLAAIAEDRGKWDEARAQYESAIQSGGATNPFLDYAKLRISLLPKISEPILLGAPRPPETQPSQPPRQPRSAPVLGPPAPTSGPAGPGPTTGPTTVPTTGPAAEPTTRPAAPSSTPAPATTEPSSATTAPSGPTTAPTVPTSAPSNPTTAPSAPAAHGQ